MTCERRILDALAGLDTIALLKRLVAVPSISGNEGELARVVGDLLRHAGCDVTFQTVEGSRCNVIGTYRFPVAGPTLMFNGHLDTVTVARGWRTDPYVATERDGCLFGLGALDMKAGIAASITAARALIAEGEGLRGTLLVTGVVDEEGYSSGARSLLTAGLSDVDAIILGEPYYGTTESPVPVLTPGKVLYRVTVKGRSAHGFLPREGVNAIDDAARIILSLPRLRRTDHPQLGIGPVCTLKVAGGYEEYAVVVPETCEAIISRMTVPGESSAQCLEDAEDLIDSLDLDSDVLVEVIPPFYEPVEADPVGPVYDDFRRAYQDELGRSPIFGHMTTITDASIFQSLAGIPTIVFGPDGGGIHQADEFVTAASVEACARIYARTAARFLSHDDSASC